MTDRRLTGDGRGLPPPDAEYWERLAARIDAAAATRAPQPDASWLGKHGARVGGAGVVAAAALLAWVLMQPPAFGRAPAVARRAVWQRSIAPTDALGRALAVDQPPGLGAFLLAASRSGGGSPGERP